MKPVFSIIKSKREAHVTTIKTSKYKSECKRTICENEYLFYCFETIALKVRSKRYVPNRMMTNNEVP